MGRYSTEIAGPAPSPNGVGAPYQPNNNWPSVFNKPVVGLDLNGVIIEDTAVDTADQIKILPGVLDAIRIIRLKGYKLVILSDQPAISTGKLTTSKMDTITQELMVRFGYHGIMTIDGFLYNTSDFKDDEFAKPNLGMVKRAETEILRGTAKFKDGWYVGDSSVDLKFASKMNAIPVLVKSGNYKEALAKLDTFAYKDIKSKTIIVDNLLDFANSLP